MTSSDYLEKRLLSFFGMGQEIHFLKDEIIITPGEEPGGVYLLRHGYVSSYTLSRYGDCNLLILHRPGEIFPLSAVLQEQLPTSYHQAKSDVTLLRLSRAAFWSGVHGDASLAQAVTAQLLGLSMLYEQHIRQLELRTARERVMACLYLYALRYGTHRGSRTLLDIPMTHQDMADSLNMTRETASRELERLAREKIITQEGRQIIINDTAQLRSAFE